MNTAKNLSRHANVEITKEITKEYVSCKQEHEAVLEDHNQCCLCGSKLNFKHQIDFAIYLVKEEAHCPSCQIQMKRRDYTLQ